MIYPLSFLSQNYNSILNSVIRRRDNGMHFARQGSASQAYFMRQATIEEVFTISYTPLFVLINFQGTDSVIAMSC
jgi:hypothetical protein